MSEKEKMSGRAKKIFIAVLVIFIAALSFGGGYLAHYLSQSENQRTAAWVISMIDKNYLVYDEDTGEIKRFTPEDYADALSSILDRYSGYYTREEYSDVIDTSHGNRFGIGVSFISDGDLTIVEVSGNSPAARAGVKAGGLIKRLIIGGEEVAVDTFDEFSAALGNVSPNESFVLVVEYGGEEKSFTLARESFVESFVFYRDSGTGYGFVGSPAVGTENEDADERLADDTAYIKYSSFMYGSTEQLGEALDFAAARGRSKLILDLRGNGGGYMDVLTDVAKFFIGTGKKRNLVAVARDKNGKESNFYTGDNKYKPFERTVALADGNTASASECLIGALLYYGTIDEDEIVIAKVRGKATTYGKGIMQTTYPHVLNRDALKLTTAYIYWPDGKTNIHGKGISATAENSVLPSANGDAELERAVEILAS